ncbi:hypothetical protein TWF594_010568 [Orbilia oligospora]|nr:hypothetical protein TWF706_007808 [Orbilia oligospora]KAF3129992.1 hypothetical protein TWF594_010568 [Orbilia oligospora]
MHCHLQSFLFSFAELRFQKSNKAASKEICVVGKKLRRKKHSANYRENSSTKYRQTPECHVRITLCISTGRRGGNKRNIENRKGIKLKSHDQWKDMDWPFFSGVRTTRLSPIPTNLLGIQNTIAGQTGDQEI